MNFIHASVASVYHTFLLPFPLDDLETYRFRDFTMLRPILSFLILSTAEQTKLFVLLLLKY